MQSALLIQPLNQSTETIQQSIAKSEIQMLFNVNSYTPLYAFIPAMVSICHIVNLQLDFIIQFTK